MLKIQRKSISPDPFYINSNRKEEIIAKAAELFRLNGYYGTTMRILGDACGIERASLYSHFVSKSEILYIICFRISVSLEQHLSRAFCENGNVMDRLEAFLRKYIRMKIEMPNEMYVYQYEPKNLVGQEMQRFIWIRRRFHSSLVNLVKEGINLGEISLPNPGLAVSILLAGVNGIEHWHHTPNGISKQDLEDNMLKYLIALTITS